MINNLMKELVKSETFDLIEPKQTTHTFY